MSLKIWLANIVLAVAVFFVGMKSLKTWTDRRSVEIVSGQPTSDWSEKVMVAREVPPEMDYETVVKENPFFPDRSEVVEEPQEGTPAETEVKVLGPQLQMLEQMAKQTNLYGVFIVNDRREAFIGGISEGKRITVGGNEIRRAKVGDTVGRFEVKEIHEKWVILTAGGHEWQISLFDKDKPKARASAKKDAGPVVIGAAFGTESTQASDAGEEKSRESKTEIPEKAKPDEGKRPQVSLPLTDKVRPDATPSAIRRKPISDVVDQVKGK